MLPYNATRTQELETPSRKMLQQLQVYNIQSVGCGDFTAADTCESLEITSSDKVFGCSITRTWTASGCDESASADQLVTLTGDCCDGMILSLQLYSSR